MNGWKPCSEKPSNCRRVLIWHRVRPWCRFFSPTVGWWNSVEWLREDSNRAHMKIYQPTLWREIEAPTDEEMNQCR